MRPKRFGFTLAAAATGVLMISAPASAKRKNVPLGNSAISQYVEVIPSASGGRPTSNISPPSGGGKTPSGPSAVPASTSKALASQGPLGAADAAVAQATAPARLPHPAANIGQARSTAPPRIRGSQARTQTNRAIPSSGGASPAADVFKALGGASGGGGLGVLLPVILAISVLGGGAVARVRKLRAPG